MEPVSTQGAGGVTTTVFTQRYACRAEFIYSKGSEVVEAARLEGRPIYKLRVRSCSAVRAVTTDWRLRDARRNVEYAIIEADSITDRRWTYIVIEGGKAG
ncbi:hypothetical protein TM49_01575 [Martelella endophytica]|uniref:Phage head-tail adapter protein n=1 Tax=Martelella endophytica TaxID=1486262 RepID=A0A0D5LV09_MAREN|nr:hypothetical protein TM49_01575 [Martelella endophytica]